ncbi:unnamed protein product, partial [Discosporangium mesarthrocarpum]
CESHLSLASHSACSPMVNSSRGHGAYGAYGACALLRDGMQEDLLGIFKRALEGSLQTWARANALHHLSSKVSAFVHSGALALKKYNKNLRGEEHQEDQEHQDLEVDEVDKGDGGGRDGDRLISSLSSSLLSASLPPLVPTPGHSLQVKSSSLCSSPSANPTSVGAGVGVALGLGLGGNTPDDGLGLSTPPPGLGFEIRMDLSALEGLRCLVEDRLFRFLCTKVKSNYTENDTSQDHYHHYHCDRDSVNASVHSSIIREGHSIPNPNPTLDPSLELGLGLGLGRSLQGVQVKGKNRTSLNINSHISRGRLQLVPLRLLEATGQHAYQHRHQHHHNHHRGEEREGEGEWNHVSQRNSGPSRQRGSFLSGLSERGRDGGGGGVSGGYGVVPRDAIGQLLKCCWALLEGDLGDSGQNCSPNPHPHPALNSGGTTLEDALRMVDTTNLTLRTATNTKKREAMAVARAVINADGNG